MNKTITLIAAMGNNRAIGLDGRMPWHIPAELQHFKRATMGKTIVMGRKTWQSIGRPLPGRQNIVISRNPEFTAGGAEVAGSLERAIEMSRRNEIMIIGGGQLYRQALPLAKRLLLTLIDTDPEADTWFPEWSESDWQVTDERYFPAGEDSEYTYRIVNLERRPDSGVH